MNQFIISLLGITLVQDLILMIGIAGAIVGVYLYVPQIRHTLKVKSAADLAMGTYRMILVNDIMWSCYGTLSDNIIIATTNVVSTGLCVFIIMLKKHYDKVNKSLT